ncbi:MAG: SGNH/GDSL hydrolase family protein [Clostridia bacterium]
MLAVVFLLIIATLFYLGISTVKEQKTLSDNIAILEEMEKKDPAELLAAEVKGGIHVTDFQAEQSKIVNLDPTAVDKTSLLRQFKNKVILGDSLAKACTGYGYLNDYIVFAEIGVSLTNSDELFEAAESAAPSMIFLCFGINDIKSCGERSDIFIKNYTKRITELQKSLPHTVIYVQGILPPASVKANSPYQYREKYNQELEKMCDDLGVYYFNADFILEQLPSLYDVDGLHPKGDFYPLWLTYLADIAGL